MKYSQIISLILAPSMSLMLVVSGNSNHVGVESVARVEGWAGTPSLLSSLATKRDAAGERRIAGQHTAISASSSGCSGVSFTQPAGSPVGAGTSPQSVGVADFNLDGKLDLCVANFDDNNVTILLGNGNGGFTQPVGSPVGVGTNPVSVSVGDFNSDGKPDIAVANQNSSNVTILLGNGIGGFTQPASSPVGAGSSPNSIAVADFNSDGRADLAVANFNSNNVTILLGNGSGGFTQPAGSPVAAGANPFSLSVGDFNLDGKPDLTIANFSSNNVTILIGNGSGGFTQPGGSPVGVGANPASATVGDFNQDGKPDIAVANAGSNNVTILLGNGSGAFTQPAGSPFATGSLPDSIGVGDFNRDGKPDLAVANDASHNLTILIGDGDGGFTQPAASPIGGVSFPHSIAVGDFNLDGKPDIAGANFNTNNVTVLLNNCDAFPCSGIGFTQPAGSPIGAGFNPRSVAVGDFNLDGKPDIAVANIASSNVTILLGNASGGFTPPPGSPFVTGSGPESLVVADFNLDGKPDLALADEGDNTATILLGDGSGGFTQSAGSPFHAGGTPIFLAAGDFNLDGKPDLAVVNSLSGGLTILLGDGSGGLIEPGSQFNDITAFTRAVVVGDFNLDGKPDLAVTSVNANVNVVTILLGNGAGGFLKATGSPISVGSDAGPGFLALGDLNQDGKPDLAVVSGFGSFLTILLGDGAGGFTEAAGSPISVRFGSESVAVADFNLDGKLDLAVTNSRSNDVTILLGNGGGQFSAAAGSPVSAGDEPFSLAVGDFNLDGKPDLVVANLRSNNVTIQLNTCLACTSTCPSNVTTPNDPNQCGAVVTFAAQSSCSPPACSPASGSFLPVGTTTVTCNSNGAGPCSFSVTVRDTQAPTISCAANTTASAQAACPPSATAVGNFTVTATDNCPGVSVVCRDQNNQIVASGQAFPVGMTTVTCSATDSSDNTAQCSFAVSAFSFCLQDESNPGNVVLVNAQSGDFSFCCGGVTIASGRGTLTTRGCIGAIDGTKGDRKVHIQWDTSSNSDTGAGTASLQKLSNKVVCQITDKNLSNNTCQCSNGPPLANPKK